MRTRLSRRICLCLAAMAMMLASHPQMISRAPAASSPSPEYEIPSTWSLLTFEIQRELADLGLYKGEATGFADSDLLETVIRYQQENGLASDGRLTQDLLDHIRSTGRAEHLLASLERNKERNRENARTSLMSQEETRDLVALPAPVEVADPTRDPSHCLANPSVQCLIDEALESAKAVNKPEFRQWVFRDVMKAQAYSGMDQEARTTIRRLEDPRLMLVALQEQVAILAGSGRLDRARRLANTIPAPLQRAKALAELVVFSPNDKNLRAETYGLIGQLAAPMDRIDISTTLASRLWLAGAKAEAAETLEIAQQSYSSLNNDDHRDSAIIMIEGARTEMGDIASLEQAITRYEEREEYRYLVVALCELAKLHNLKGQTETAADLLERARRLQHKTEGYPALFTLSKIAETEARLDQFPQALETASGIDKASLRARTFWAIASLTPAGGDKHSWSPEPEADRFALETLDAIRNDYDKISLLGTMTTQLNERGNNAKARLRFARAVAIAGGITNNWWRAPRLQPPRPGSGSDQFPHLGLRPVTLFG